MWFCKARGPSLSFVKAYSASGYSTLLMDGLAENPRLHPAAEQIQKAGQRAAALTRQLLVFSRQQFMQGSTA